MQLPSRSSTESPNVKILKSRVSGIATAAALALLPLAASAGSFSISPIRLELGEANPNGALTVRNGGDEPVVIQLQPMAWSQSDGEDQLDPTREVLATPAVFTLDPGGSQLVRVALRRVVDPTRELSYRLVLQEVPAATRPDATGARIALRMSLPVFVKPSQAAEPDLVWTAVVSGEQETMLTARNTGNVHIQLAQLSLDPSDGASIANPAMAYILPGESRSWPLLGAIGAGTALRLSGVSDNGPITARVEVGSE